MSNFIGNSKMFSSMPCNFAFVLAKMIFLAILHSWHHLVLSFSLSLFFFRIFMRVHLNQTDASWEARSQMLSIILFNISHSHEYTLIFPCGFTLQSSKINYVEYVVILLCAIVRCFFMKYFYKTVAFF